MNNSCHWPLVLSIKEQNWQSWSVMKCVEIIDFCFLAAWSLHVTLLLSTFLSFCGCHYIIIREQEPAGEFQGGQGGRSPRFYSVVTRFAIQAAQGQDSARVYQDSVSSASASVKLSIQWETSRNTGLLKGNHWFWRLTCTNTALDAPHFFWAFLEFGPILHGRFTCKNDLKSFGQSAKTD